MKLLLRQIDFVLYFAPLLFQQAGLSESSASFLASGVTSLVILATSAHLSACLLEQS